MANLSFVDSESIHRLEGSSEESKGGLILMKKRITPDDDNSLTFKKPKTSLLGLDRLAAIKNKIREEEEVDKDKKWKEKKRSSFHKDDDVDDDYDQSDYRGRDEDIRHKKRKSHKDLKER